MRREYFTDLKKGDYLRCAEGRFRYDVLELDSFGTILFQDRIRGARHVLRDHDCLSLDGVGRVKNFGYMGTGARVHVGIRLAYGDEFKRIRPRKNEPLAAPLMSKENREKVRV